MAWAAPVFRIIYPLNWKYKMMKRFSGMVEQLGAGDKQYICSVGAFDAFPLCLRFFLSSFLCDALENVLKSGRKEIKKGRNEEDASCWIA
jgi:hypothetical protein